MESAHKSIASLALVKLLLVFFNIKQIHLRDLFSVAEAHKCGVEVSIKQDILGLDVSMTDGS